MAIVPSLSLPLQLPQCARREKRCALNGVASGFEPAERKQDGVRETESRHSLRTGVIFSAPFLHTCVKKNN